EGVAAIAREAAAHSDLIVLVVDGDLTRTEAAAFDVLAARSRGLVVALAKSDARREEETHALLASIRERLGGRIDPERVVAVRARPLARPVAVRLPDGTETLEIRELAPDVAPLRAVLLEVAASAGLSLLARNVFQWAGEIEARIAGRLTDIRRERAEGLLWSHAAKSAAAAAVVPSVAADIALAAYIQGKMLREIAAVFGVDFSVDQAKAMTRELTLAAGKLGLVGAATRLAVEAVNLVPLAGFATSAAVQGTTAAYATYVAGHAFIDWCAAGARWPEGSAADALARTRGRLEIKDLVRELARRGPRVFGGAGRDE
ncbi:MAG: DUF697 domain-containing protein, partial [Myxococcales bacterium]|nr:DUF697 domain-containing protein [Myxococcales bacterium]